MLLHAWSWTGVVLVLALSAVFTSWATRQESRYRWLLVALAAAALLGPAEQAVLHTIRFAEQARRGGRLVRCDRRRIRR